MEHERNTKNRLRLPREDPNPWLLPRNVYAKSVTISPYRRSHKPGQINIRAVLEAAEERMKLLREYCEDLDFSPQKRLIEMAKNGELAAIDPKLEVATLVSLMEFLEPKLKAAAITVNNRPVGELTEAELLELVEIRDEATSGGGAIGASRGEVVPLRLCAPIEAVSDASETS